MFRNDLVNRLLGKRTRRLGVVLAAALTVLGADTSKAQAQNPPLYGGFVIENPTPVTLNYSIRWGNGDWKAFSVAPGTSITHQHLLNAGGQVPAPQIQFDGVGNGVLTHNLNTIATNVPTGGKPYQFAYSPNGRCLDLYPR
jgi:hypothetical protein